MQKIGLEAVLNMANFNQGMRQYTAGVSQMQGETSRAAGLFSSLNSALTTVAGVGFLVIASGAAKVAYELAKVGAEALRVENAFYRVAAGAGQSGSELEAALERGANGMAQIEDVMRVVTRATIMGVKLSSKQWEALAVGAREQARLWGSDFITMFEGIVTAIERGQPRMLYRLGFTGARDAIKEIGAAADGTGEMVADADRQMALYNLTVAQFETNAKLYGTATADMITATTQLRNEWIATKKEFAKQVTPLVTPVVVGLRQLVTPGAAEIARVQERTYRALTGGLQTQRAILADSARWTALGKAVQANADAMNNFVSALPSKSDLEGWKAYIATASAAAAAAKAVTTLADVTSKARGDLRGEEKYTGDMLAARGESAVQIAEANAQFLKDNEKLAEDTAKLWEDAAKDAANSWESAWDSLRGSVEAALQPTQVTNADWNLTQLGIYTDKWDENVRRLSAIAQNGFAELQAHTDWADILMIPEHIRTGSEQQLKDWARAMADARPAELMDVNAAVATVEQYMAKQAAWESFVNQVATEYARRHGLTTAQGKAAVTGAVGSTTEQTKSAIEALPQQIGGWVKAGIPQIETAAKPIGTAILSGIEKGIVAGWASFENFLTAQVNGLVDKILDLLDAGSPSRVFADIGRSMVTGLQQGVASLSTANASLAVGAPAGAASPGMGGVTNNYVGGETIVQNISDPTSFFLAQAIVQDKRRDRWNAAMGVT